MKYKILKYINNPDDVKFDCYFCEDENGKRMYIDLFRDGSHKGFGNLKGDIDKKRESFIGKIVEIKELFPYTPLYFAKNVKLLTKL